MAISNAFPNGTEDRVSQLRAISTIVTIAALASMFQLVTLPAEANSEHDCPTTNGDFNPDCGTHNMMLVGKDSVYLSHLPMFHSEHRFQVIIEAMFEKGGQNLQRLYAEDRKEHPDTRMYTVSPGDIFVLSRLFDAELGLKRPGFLGTVYRGHLERGGKEIEGMQGVDIQVVRVIYGRELQADNEASEELRYILFGNDDELFLAHQITQPPDFDQIVAVKIHGHHFTANELQSGVILSVPGRENTGAARLRVNESVTALARINESVPPQTLQLEVLAEPYFEDGELQSEPTFARTPLEIEAGF